MKEYADSWLDVLCHLLESARRDLEAAKLVQGASQIETNVERTPYIRMSLDRVRRVAENIERVLEGGA